MLPVETPFKTYTGLDGKPLDNGYVYFGQPDKDPITHPVTVFWDAAGTMPAAQPLRTVNGYIMRTGTPANVFFSGSYSELVKDAKGRQVYYARASDEFSVAAVVGGLASSSGAGSVGFIQAGIGAAARTLLQKERDVVSITDYTTPKLADSSGMGPIFSPRGTHASTVANGAALTAAYYGLGQIRTADNNKRGKFFSAVNAPPVSGNETSVDTAFNGDWGAQNFSIEHRITGAATLGQPTSGYLYKPEAMPNYTYLYNESGWNQSVSGNDGRTGVAAYRARVYQAGQGDAAAFNASVFVTGAKAGATHWLANPAGVLFNGDMTAGANGVYLNPYETICDDGGFDVACIGLVNNFKRTNAGGALSTFWGGYRAQNVGSVACDAIVSAVGKWQTGLDFSMPNLDFGANRAAISLKANQRIYLNNAAVAAGPLGANWRATVFNGDWFGYDTNINGVIFAVGGNPNLQITATRVTIARELQHAATTLGFYSANPVGKQAITGSRGGNAALQSVIAALANLGLLTDNTTA